MQNEFTGKWEKYADAVRFRSHVLRGEGEFLVTSAYGYRTHPVTGELHAFHSGVDGALWTGRELVECDILAWGDGIVLRAEDSDGDAGSNVVIDHGGGFVTKYFHLEKGSIRVHAGDRVRRGDTLGYMGKTGRATGEHLHFQAERDGKPVDPLPYLQSQENNP